MATTAITRVRPVRQRSTRARVMGRAIAVVAVTALTACGGASGPTGEEVSTPRSLAALVLRHVGGEPTYAFPGDAAGSMPGLVSAAVWFSGRPGHLPDGGPDVVEVYAAPADSEYAEFVTATIAEDEPDSVETLADGATLYADVGEARTDGGDDPAGTTPHAVFVVVGEEQVLVVEYHGTSIPHTGAGLTVEALEALARDELLGLRTSDEAIAEGDGIGVWRD